MDLNDSFTENLLQRSKTRKDYLNAKMYEPSCPGGRKRTASGDRNVVDDSPKRQCLNPSESDEKENSFVPSNVLSNVRGLAALRKQYNNPDTCKNFNTIGGKDIHDSKQENREKAIFLTEPSDTPKNDGIKNYNSDEIIPEEKETSKKEEESHFRFEPNNNSEPAVLPLAARKAIFEKAATIQSSKSNGPAFQPKLSIAQRTAMFENAAKGSQVKPQAKRTLPKRFVPSVSIKTSEVNGQGDLEKESSQEDTSTSSMQGSNCADEAASATSEKSVPLSNDNIHLTSNPAEQKSVEDIVSSPRNSVSDNVFDFLQHTEGNSEESVPGPISTHFESINSNTPVQTLSPRQQFSEGEDIKTLQKSVETTSRDLLQKYVEASVLQQNSVSGCSIDSHQRFSEKSAADSFQSEVTFEGANRNVIPSLVNHWEKLSSSSSFGNSNSEEESYTTIQLQKSRVNAYESEGDNADCESNLESEYTAAESMSEYNEGESILGSKTWGSTKDLSLTDLEDDAMEQEVFNPVQFSTEAGLSQFDVETDSFLATDDETASRNGQNWQGKFNDSIYSTDDISLKSAISETSLDSESTSNNKVPQSPTHSCTESVGKTEKKEAAVRASGSSVGSPLVHTVSFYRKQRLGSKSSPVMATKVPHSLSENGNPTQEIQQQIKVLKEEIVRQQAVISQTSQALNLCSSTAEFSGSSEQIEAERLLLIATQKRQACYNEIQSLRSRGSEGECIPDGSGTLSISDLKLPLKQGFIASQLKGDMSSVHCFLCMIRHGPQVIVTQMVSTSDAIKDGSLSFSKHIKLQNLPPDFSIVFEVYTLQTSKENLSHDKKYHIKREPSKIRLNAKGKNTENKLVLKINSSPGGPNAIRTPSFTLIGYTRFTVQNCNKKCFSLDKIPFTSPLEGILKVKLHLHAEHTTSEKGFLTRFEDVGGYGLWNRLWCSLDSHHLRYWKYPDEEEQKKEPLGTINLRQCLTKRVGPVSRDVCARNNTFLVMTVREREKGDRNTLVSESVDKLTTTRHLLSADTKEERVVWCNKLNEALANVRKWDARALRPIEDQKE